MTSLLEQARQVRAGLKKVQVANQLRHQLQAIQIRSGEWDNIRRKRLQLLERTGYLATADAQSADMLRANEAARALCDRARDLLQQAQDVSILSEDALWTRLLQAAEKANSICEEAIRSTWRAYVSGLGSPDSPNALAARVPATPANEPVLNNYRLIHNKYAALARAEAPANAQSAADLRDYVAQLRDIISTLVSAPEAVQKFFKAVEGSGASLELLTAEVLEWLKQYDDATRFVIKTRTDQPWR
jgi:hypothetical protein